MADYEGSESVAYPLLSCKTGGDIGGFAAVQFVTPANVPSGGNPLSVEWRQISCQTVPNRAPRYGNEAEFIYLKSRAALQMLGARGSLDAIGGNLDQGPEGDFRGTWTKAADADAPLVLIIPGSGPTDRDGNSPLGIEAGTYRLLAEGLGQKGISTVRVDKRGIGASAGAVSNANAVTIDDYVSDARAWVDDIRRRTGTSCVWILGHSEGGLVALATAQKSPDICGLILVATAGHPMGDVVKEQLRAQPANAPLLPKADAAIDALAAGERVDADAVPPALAPLFAPAVQGFLISAFALDPADLAGRVEKPILIVQGDRDIQVGVPDAKALKAAAPTAELAVIPDVNHVLKVVSSDDTAANIATYADPTLPIAPGIIETIADFLERQTAANPF